MVSLEHKTSNTQTKDMQPCFFMAWSLVQLFMQKNKCNQTKIWISYGYFPSRPQHRLGFDHG